LMKLMKSSKGLENIVYDRRMRELRAERLRKRVINAKPLTVDDYEGFHREDEAFCEHSDQQASQDKIRALRIERLKEIIALAHDPAGALEKEIRRCSLWVEDEMQEVAKNLLFDLRQESIHKQVVTAWDKTKKQVWDNRYIPEDAQKLVDTCLIEMAKVWSHTEGRENLSEIEPFAQSLQDVQLNLLVLQHYQLRQNWVVGSKVERFEDGEWLQGEITEASPDFSAVSVRADSSMSTERYSRLDPRIRPSQPGIEPAKVRQMKLRRLKTARYGMNISDVEEQKEEEISGYQKFLGVERERKKRDLIKERGRRWEGCKAKGWSADDVIKWLKGLGRNYAVYESTFRAQSVTGPILLELDSTDLIELQVSRLHRKKMKIEIQKLRCSGNIDKVSQIARKLNKRRNTSTWEPSIP